MRTYQRPRLDDPPPPPAGPMPAAQAARLPWRPTWLAGQDGDAVRAEYTARWDAAGRPTAPRPRARPPLLEAPAAT